MNLLVISNKKIINDFRKYLLEAAVRNGNEAIHIFAWAKEIILWCNGEVVGKYKYSDHEYFLRHVLKNIVREKEFIVLTGMNGCESIVAQKARDYFNKLLFIFDVYDDFRYGGTDEAARQWCIIDNKYRRTTQGTIVLSRRLKEFYPYSFHLDNASHLKKIEFKQSAHERCDKVVYVGSIDDRTDFSVIEKFAAHGVSVDVYGKVHERRPDAVKLIRMMESKNNLINYHGSYVNDDLGNILEKYRVGLVPYYINNKMTNFINPDKIYHYLNSGLEVISTGIPQAKIMERYVELIDNNFNPVEVLNFTIKRNKSKTWNYREYSWDKRWNELKDYCEKIGKQKF